MNDKEAKHRKGGFSEMHDEWQPEVLDLSEEDLKENEALSKEFYEEFEKACSVTQMIKDDQD